MDELLVVDAQFTEDQLLIFAKHKIQLPKKGEIVSLVKIEKLKNAGKISLIVSPYDNQWIVDKGFEKEVGFKKERFVTLLGDQITDEMLENELKSAKTKQKEVVKIISKPYQNN